MDAKRRDQQRPSRGASSTNRAPSRNPQGFAGLDPTALGLDGPDWLTPSLRPTDEPPAAAEPLALPADLPLAPPEVAPAPPRSMLEGMKVVCICKGIKQSVFWRVLDAGAQSTEEINRLTGSGSGGCQGRRCGPRITDLLRARAR